MAHAYFASIEEELTCCVCFELFVNPHIPKDLDCPHVICEQCLTKLSTEGIIDCPECRVVTMVPTDGVSGLKTNLRVRNLAEKHKRHSKILTTKKPLGKQQAVSQGIPHCSTHKGEPLVLFCVTCNNMVCQVCVTKTHVGDEHNIKTLEAVHRGKVSIMGVNISRSEKMASQLEKLSQELGEAEENLVASVKKQEGTIDQAVALIVANARKQGDMLKAKIRGKNQSKLDDCHKQKAALQKQVHDLKKVVLDAKEAMQNSSTHEYVFHHHKQITERLKTIQNQRYVTYVDYSPYEINASVEQLARNMVAGDHDPNKRSNASKKESSNSTPAERKPIRKLTLHTKWEGFRSVTCVASNRTSQMLVISENNSFCRNQVHIYCKQSRGNYRKQTILNVPDKCGIGSCSIAVAPNGRFLVTRGRSVHVYSSSGNYQKYFHTTQDTDTVNLTCIAVTKEDKIIIGDQKRSLVTHHTPGGDLLKGVQTNVEPTCLAVINNTNVVVGSSIENRACVIDLEAGKEVMSFDIVQPLCMHYDEKTECLLVGRAAKTGVVEQWSLTSGHYIACIVQGIANPQAMTVNHDGFLVVGDAERVTFYKMAFH